MVLITVNAKVASSTLVGTIITFFWLAAYQFRLLSWFFKGDNRVTISTIGQRGVERGGDIPEWWTVTRVVGEAEGRAHSGDAPLREYCGAPLQCFCIMGNM